MGLTSHSRRWQGRFGPELIWDIQSVPRHALMSKRLDLESAS
jgi:hypothetical protein